MNPVSGISQDGILLNASEYDAENGISRDPKGRFLQGNPPGPGSPRSVYTEEYLEQIAYDYIEWLLADEKNIAWHKFAKDRNLTYDIWWKYYDDQENNAFRYCHEIAKRIKTEKLFGNALEFKWDKVMSIFALKNVSGWADKIEHTNTNRSIQIVIESKIPPALSASKIPDALPEPPKQIGIADDSLPFTE